MTTHALFLAADVTAKVAATLEHHAREAELRGMPGAEETREAQRQAAALARALRNEADRAAALAAP